MCLKLIVHSSALSPIFRLSMLLSVLIAFSAPAGYSQSAPPSENGSIEDVFLAKTNGEGEPGEEVDGFLTTDIPIFCVVYLATTEPVTVRLNFVAVKVNGVRAETRVVSTSYTTKEGETRVNFSGRPHRAWHAGRYRADIFVEDKLERSIEFDIRVPVGSRPAANSLAEPTLRVRRTPPRRRP